MERDEHTIRKFYLQVNEESEKLETMCELYGILASNPTIILANKRIKVGIYGSCQFRE